MLWHMSVRGKGHFLLKVIQFLVFFYLIQLIIISSNHQITIMFKLLHLPLKYCTCRLKQDPVSVHTLVVMSLKSLLISWNLPLFLWLSRVKNFWAIGTSCPVRSLSLWIVRLLLHGGGLLVLFELLHKLKITSARSSKSKSMLWQEHFMVDAVSFVFSLSGGQEVGGRLTHPCELGSPCDSHAGCGRDLAIRLIGSLLHT